MELSNFRQESHVAQQSRRDKLRVQQQCSISQAQHLEDYSSNLEQLSSVHHQALNPDLIEVSTVRYGNISYNPAMFTSEMINFAANSHVLLPQKDGLVVRQESTPDHGSPGFPNSSHPISSVLNAASKASGDPQNCGNWKSIGSSQQSCDWIVNYSSGLSASESNQNHPVLFVGEGLTSSVNANNHLPSPAVYLKSSFNGYQDVNPSSEVSSQNNSQKHYGEIHFSSSSLYQNNPLAGVTSSMAGTEGLELASLVHQNPGRDNELLLLPAYGDQSNPWSSELGFLANKSNRDLRTVLTSDSNTQGLSLSLSPGLPTKSHNIQFGQNLHSGTGVFNDHHGSRACLKSEYSCFNSKPSSSSDKVLGNACQDLVGSSAIAHRSTGPLGPFTGYATILKGSKFLKPAQQLLDEICFVTSAKSVETSEVSDKVSNEVRGSADAVNASESVIRAKGGDSGVSSSTFYSSKEISGDGCVRSSSGESSRPEYQHKKAKLLFMQDEVCRRYKQYHQQMQMVVSSFESVAGLSAAAPYISSALKTVSRHFRCLRIAISDQLKHIRKALGEDFSSPATGASSSKGDTSSSRLKFFDHSFTKQKSGGGGTLGFFEPQQQQHIWRPQRGLPERAVAILRAWLFEHFLHPYPTDTDKHMLATQTGLSRNQVSNWFINARVRVWKPMVEEIHMLETKGLAEPNLNAGKINDGNPTAEDASRTYNNQSTNKFSVTAIPGKHVDSFQIGQNVEQWNQEKRSRVECQIPAGAMDGSLMGFVPYQRSGLEMGGLGAVSLTLGLRQSAEGAQQQQQQQLQQEEEHQLRQHFGSQMIHDFVG